LTLVNMFEREREKWLLHRANMSIDKALAQQSRTDARYRSAVLQRPGCKRKKKVTQACVVRKLPHALPLTMLYQMQ